MKNLIITAVFFLISLISFSQKIVVNATQVKDFTHKDSVSIKTTLQGQKNVYARDINSTYTFDLDKKIIKFKTLRSEGERTINKVYKKDGVFIVGYEDDYVTDQDGNKLQIFIVIDTNKNKVMYTYYDPIDDTTLVQIFVKNKITLN